MKNVKIVIGMNYGDEGKGNCTNYLTTKDSLVVRFNGGAQAGHTVVQDGIRHVFHSLGSGSIKGAPTMLGPKFVIDPFMFFDECHELYNKTTGHLNLRVFADPECRVVTPYDVFLNQAIEKKRGNNRHGSCGMGFGETVKRNNEGLILRLKDYDDVINILNKIRDRFFKKVKDLCLDIDFCLLECVVNKFFIEMNSFMNHVKIVDFNDIEKSFDDIVFEGAQGLCLDQNSTDFPHVTYSNTGLDNVIELLNNKSHFLEIYYVTRTYCTKHGAGYLKNEYNKPDGVIDETNIHNEYQGSIRFAPLDFERMKINIKNDLNKARNFNCKPNMAITCCDQNIFPVNDIIENVGINDYITCWSDSGKWKVNRK